MAQTIFNNPKEFLEEVKKDAEKKEIDRNFVRLTTFRQSGKGLTGIYFYSVLASYKVANGDIVKLNHYCGEKWGEGFEGDKKTDEIIAKVKKQIEDGLKKLGVEIRNGDFQISSDNN